MTVLLEILLLVSVGSAGDVEPLITARLRRPRAPPCRLGLAQEFGGPDVAGTEPRIPLQLELFELGLPPDRIERFDRAQATYPFGDFGDALFRGPETLLDSALRALTGLYPRSDASSDTGRFSSGITERIFELETGPRQGRIVSEFASAWLERERRFFSRYADAGVDTAGWDEGTEDLDARVLLSGQGKVLWDAVRDTYLSKYRFRGEERIREDAFYFSEWRTIDLVVLPPIVAGYVWWRGLEKRASLGETWLRISVEPLSTWIPGHEDTVACVSVEWGIEGFPVGLIVSAGTLDGAADLDFVGIGTSIGIVRHALGVRLGE